MADGVPSTQRQCQLSSHLPSSQQAEEVAQAQKFWQEWVEEAFPDLDSHCYFLPPVYVNCVPMTRQTLAGRHVTVLHEPVRDTSPPNRGKIISDHPGYPASPREPAVQNSDVRNDAATQRVVTCLQKMLDGQKEVVFGLSQLQFGQYLADLSCAGTAAQLPVPASLPPSLPHRWKRGDFDVLLIHRHYGFVVCEVKAFGGNAEKLNMSDDVKHKNIRKKLKQAVEQLDKAEAMLSHLVSDIPSGVLVSKTIAFPNVTALQLQQAVGTDLKLTEELHRCLGARDLAGITDLCLCSDHLSDPKAPSDVSDLSQLASWWQRRVAGFGADARMTSNLYKTLVARFCGPATIVTVPCTSAPRLCVKTLCQAVSATGLCYAQMALFPEQVDLISRAPPRVFLAGPPGTGKSVVLLLMATEWLRRGSDAYVLSTYIGSRAACVLLHDLLQQTRKEHLDAGGSPGQVHLVEYNFLQKTEEQINKAVEDLSQVVKGGTDCVIADEAGPDWLSNFKTFCNNLLTRLPGVQLWAANCYEDNVSEGWELEWLTRPLRCPPSVRREVEQGFKSSRHCVRAYSQRGVPDHTDGPPVIFLSHRGQGHSEGWMKDDDFVDLCDACGQEVAAVLHNLRVGAKGDAALTGAASKETSPPALQYRDVLVLHWGDIREESAVVRGMRGAGIPVQVIKNDADLKDVATAHTDVVWVGNGYHVRGLERKVIVCLGKPDNLPRLHIMARCTSQLVVVSRC